MPLTLSSDRGAPEKLDAYQKRLFFFLSVATFFEGYDFFALTQVLPHLRTDLGLSHAGASRLLGFINVGTVLAYLLIGRADVWGRKKVLSVTIFGYTILTALSGLAPNVYAFALFQMLARIFLIAEWATSMVIAAEEFPAERRGMVMGVIGAAAGLGSVVCVGVVPPLTAAFGWRSVYFVGVFPLLLMAFARRGLRETRRFAEAKPRESKTSFFAVWRSPFRKRVIELGAIWFMTYMATQNAVSVWKDYALTELHLAENRASLAMMIAALVAMPIVFFSGKLIDLIGRRRGAAVILLSTSAGVLGSYTLTSFWPLTLSLTFAVVGVSAVLTVLNAFTTELFPTDLRSNAFAWSNNLLGRIGYWLSPFLIGEIAQSTGWATPLRWTAVFPVIALGLVLWRLPETRGKELEDSAVPPENS
jgi:putative MFS transporter